MKIKHPKLGNVKVLIEFEGKKNRLALVSADVTEGMTKSWPYRAEIRDNKIGAKPKHWLLWGSLEQDITDMGKTCLLNKSGSTYTQSKAVQLFMYASTFVDQLTMRKIEDIKTTQN